MEEEPVLREATSRRDSALSEARRLDDFIRLYNELRGSRGASLTVVGEGAAKSTETIGGDFILDKQRR
jgi:hypothetical protein